MGYQLQDDNRYHVPIIDLGTRLRDNFGLTIREHSHFDEVDNVHSRNSYHYYDEALDIQDWRDDNLGGVDWKTRTGNLENLMRGSGAEVIGPNSGVKGHGTHLHLAAKDGIFKLNQQQYDTLFGGNAGGAKATFAMQPSTSAVDTKDIPEPAAVVTPGKPDISPETETIKPTVEPTPERTEAVERAQNYSKMNKAELDSAYDAMRASDPGKAREEGMKMHNAYFGKI